jgi:hypothetical protein
MLVFIVGCFVLAIFQVLIMALHILDSNFIEDKKNLSSLGVSAHRMCEI